MAEFIGLIARRRIPFVVIVLGICLLLTGVIPAVAQGISNDSTNHASPDHRNYATTGNETTSQTGAIINSGGSPQTGLLDPTASHVNHHIIRLDSTQNISRLTRNTARTLQTTPGVKVTYQRNATGKLVVAVNTRNRTADALTEIDGIKNISSPVIYRPPPSSNPSDGSDDGNGGISTATHFSQPTSKYTYGLEQLNIPEAWKKFNTKGENVKLAVIDGGVNPSHPSIDLSGNSSNNYRGAWAVVNDTLNYQDRFPTIEGPEENPPNDISGHGTHVAGTATGQKVNGTHIGVAPNAELMVAQAAYAPGIYQQEDIALAVDWAVDNNADIISLSLGGNINSPVWQPNSVLIESVRSAQANGVTVVAASGNRGPNATSDPAAMQETISVGATTRSGTIWTRSSGMRFNPYNYYKKDQFASPQPPIINEEDIADEWITEEWENPRTTPFIVAPGENIWSADHDSNTLDSRSGTSMATPHVAGIAALAYSNNPQMTVDEFRTVLKASADSALGQPDHYNTRQGHGEIDAVEVLKLSDNNGYLRPKTLNVTETATDDDVIQITTIIKNANIIGDPGQTDVILHVNGRKVEDIASNIQLDSTEEKRFTTTYNTTDINGELNITISTVDATQSYTTNTFPLPKFNYTQTDTKVEVDASQSTDPDGEITSYEWDFTGDGETDESGVTAVHNFDNKGLHDVTLSVKDDDEAINTATKTILVGGLEPSFSWWYDTNPPKAGRPITFAGGVRHSAASPITEYAWDLDGDGKIDRYGKRGDYTYDSPGEYEVELTVTDASGRTGTGTGIVTIEETNVTLPIPKYQHTPTSIEVDEPIEFDATSSKETANAISSYEWNFNNDWSTDATGVTATHTYSTDGEYNVTLTVTDTAGNTNITTKTISVGDITAPISTYQYNPTSPEIGERVEFNASQSTDTDSAITSYEWDFNNDGTTDATGITTNHTYTTAGEYDVTLTVTDSAGNTNTTTRTVYVDGEVEIINASLTPVTVYSSPTSHTLTFDALRVSADGSRDEFSVSIPKTVKLEAANSVEVTNKGFTPSYSTENNTIHFDVNRTGPEPSVDLNVRANVTLSSAT